MDVRRRPVSAGLLTVALLLAGCGSDDAGAKGDGPNNEAGGSTTSTADGNGKPDGEKEKPAEIERLKSERVADIEPIRFNSGIGVGGEFFVLLHDPTTYTRSLARIGKDGKVGETVALGARVSVGGGWFKTDAGYYVAASSVDPDLCGYAELDVTNLGLKEIVNLTDSTGGCTLQRPHFIDGTVAMFAYNHWDKPGEVVVVDTATGENKRIPMTDEKYTVQSGAIVDGSHLLMLTPSYDAEGTMYTADDGSALPGLVLRVDPDSGETLKSIEVTPNASLDLRGGKVHLRTFPDAVGSGESVSLGEPEMVTVDPETLETEPADQGEACYSGAYDSRSVLTGDLVWDAFGDTVTAVRADSCGVVVEAELTPVEGFEDANRFATDTLLSADGDDVYVLRSFTDTDDFESGPVALALDRITRG